MRDAAIAVRELRHTYAGVTALDGVTLDLPAGGFTALLGRNGAGKTTLVHAICTLLRPAGGDVIVGGASVAESPRAVRGQLGIVFQDPVLDARLTARENLDFHARLYGVPSRERRERVRDALATVGLAERAGARAGTLSRGLKRRLEIARALTPAPRVLVLDEPTTGLDVQSRHRIWACLDALRARTGVTLLLTTHRMDEAGDADRVAVLDRGRLCALDTPDALRARSGGGALRLTLTDADTAAEAAARLPGLSFDTVARTPLADIWHHDPAFERFRGTAWMPEPCRSCERREIDFGGCRCQAFAVTGDPAATDPACAFSPHHDAFTARAEREAAAGGDTFAHRRMGGSITEVS